MKDFDSVLENNQHERLRSCQAVSDRLELEVKVQDFCSQYRSVKKEKLIKGGHV